MPQSDDVLDVLTHTFTTELRFGDILVGVTDAALKLLPGTHASVRVLNDTQTELVSSARSGQGASSEPMKFLRGEGIAGWVAEYGRAAHIADTREDNRFKAGSKSQGFEIRSVVVVPLVMAKQTIGVMAVTSPEVEAFSKRHVTLLQLLGNCSVPIIERARLQSMAAVDDVTHAYKASCLLPRLAESVRRGREEGSPLSVLLLELDQLRRVYHEHSFAVGDQVLRSFADRVRQLNPPDCWLIRRGGGSFALILPDTDRPGGVHHAECIRKDLEIRPLEGLGGAVIEQSVSVGTASLQSDESSEKLLARAEAAVAQASQGGGNRVVDGDAD